MNLTENYYLWNFNSIIISKIILKKFTHIPKIKKLSFFIIINKNYYKKNLFLFYIIISLVFNSILILKKKEIKNLQIFNLKLKNKKINFFLLSFINIYLPLLNEEKIVKNSSCSFALKKTNFLLYRLNYFSFPTIPELDLFYLYYEEISYFINKYKLQIDIYIKKNIYINNSLEFLVRMNRLPCILQ